MSEFPGAGAQVVPSGHLGQDGQVWERPWTLGEMRQTSASWSLAADSGLFLFLQDFSQRMLSKTHEIEKQLDGLIRDTKATDSCLHSVFNDFLMLSNTQFIENRVYDEEVEERSAKVENAVKHPEQTREQKEAELIPKMQEAVNYGLRVLDSAFEQLDIKAGNSESEDEDATDRVEAILEPKDLYVDRPLPYLIGSQAFMEQDDVGLGDLSSDEMSLDSDGDSVIESEDGKEEVQSDEDFEEAEGHGSINKKSSVLSYEEDEEEDEDSDIFGESDKEEEYDDENETKTAGSSSFVDELAARIKSEPVSKVEEDRASLASSKKKAKSKKVAKTEKSSAAAAAVREDSGDMFQPPRTEEEDFSPFGGKGGLFSGGRGLFDDDDEGDLFADVPKTAVSEDGNKSAAPKAESVKPERTLPAGAVSRFPADNGLFGSGNSTAASVEGRENGTHGKPKAHPSPKRPPARASGIGGGLFDDEEEEEDDFFIERSSAARGKSKAKKKVADLFLGEDDEDEEEEGDIFSEKSAVQPPAQSNKEVVEEKAKHPEKKMPAGAVSIFGPGTESLLTESLGRRRASASEEKSEENGPRAEAPVSHGPAHQTQRPQTRGLFSDDEDTQAFPPTSKSQAKPGPTRQPKAPVSLFDDEEEEDLFASVAKSKPNQAKASTPQPQKTVSLFSDDEDQWLSSKPSTGKTETKPGGMKASVSAPSDLPSVRTPPKGTLFHDNEDDDLFATTRTSSPMKSQRVALLFEDDNDEEDKGFLFGSRPAVSSSAKASAAKAPAVGPPAPSLFDQGPRKEAPVSGSVVEKAKPTEETTAGETPPISSSSVPPGGGSSETRKQKPVGAVSLFGGIDVLASRRSQGDDDGDSLTEDRLPPAGVGKEKEKKKKEEEKETKTKANAVSIFDEDDGDDDEEEDDSDWSVSSSVARTPVTRNAIQPAGEQPRTKSTGVFQDEELLFSDTQQKDNDPDVDLFAPSGKTLSAKPTSVKTDAPSLFADEDDDLFVSVKPKPSHPKVAKKPSKLQEESPSSVKGVSSASTSEANLVINPTALLPGAAPRVPGAISVLPGLTPGSSSSGVSSSSLSPSPVTTPLGSTHTGREEGVSFESPLHVATLQSTNKSRAKGSGRRRPQSRAARQQAAQRSVLDPEDSREELGPGGLNTTPSALGFPTPNLTGPLPPKPSGTSAFPTPSPSQLSTPRPSVLSLPVSAHRGKTDSGEVSGDAQALLSSDDEDLFGSVSVGKRATPPARRVTKDRPQDASPAGGDVPSKKEKESNAPLSIFDNQATSDLFQKVKPRANKAKASSFMEDADDDDDDDDDDDEDIFGMSTGSTPSSTTDSKTTPSPAKQDMFQDDETALPKAGHKKHKEKTMEASLFDDNVDIFADLTMSSGPKEKPKKKVDTKSIFDDDMDDIFSSKKVKAVTKAPPKSKKTKPAKDSLTAESANIFDDPLNALGGN